MVCRTMKQSSILRAIQFPQNTSLCPPLKMEMGTKKKSFLYFRFSYAHFPIEIKLSAIVLRGVLGEHKRKTSGTIGNTNSGRKEMRVWDFLWEKNMNQICILFKSVSFSRNILEKWNFPNVNWKWMEWKTT